MSRDPIRIHCGAGTVYLKDYLNIDLKSSRCFLSNDRPDLVEKYITDEQHYYSRHDIGQNDFLVGPKNDEYVCDAYGSFLNLPVKAKLASELLARQSFEHLSITEARLALKEMNRVLDYGGVLRIDVPDHEETLRKFVSTSNEFYIRHLLGPRNSDYGYHMMSYVKDGLIRLIEEYGFLYMMEERNIHCYPAMMLRFGKASDV